VSLYVIYMYIVQRKARNRRHCAASVLTAAAGAGIEKVGSRSVDGDV
jgi:hypothetical protein